MRIINMILLSFVLLISQQAHSQPLQKQVASATEKLLVDSVSGQILRPTNSLRDVVSTMLWNETSGKLEVEQWQLLKTHSQDDRGLVAQVLFEQGFNYKVLMYLRQVIDHSPGEVRLGAVDVSNIDISEPSGIPEFLTVNMSDWDVSLEGMIRVQYRSDIYWLLEQMRSMKELVMIYAGQTPHSPVNIFVNRHKQVKRIIDFTFQVERTLTEAQSMLATIIIKQGRFKNEPQKVAELEVIKQHIEAQITIFVKLIGDILTQAQPKSRRDRTPWGEFHKAVKTADEAFQKMDKTIREASKKAVDQIDQISGSTQSESRYADDEVPELVIKLQEHKKQLKDLAGTWSQISVYNYHDRVHKWLYQHYHSEQHGPYTLQEEYYKERNIEGIEIAPIEEETELGDYLALVSQRITERKLQREQILELRDELQKKKAQHARYFTRGAQRPPNIHANQVAGFEERFGKRNTLLQDWMDALIDNTYRHEAHEQKGYVGIEFESELSEKNQEIMKRLEAVARRFRLFNISVGVATGAAGAACFLLFAL